MYTLGLLNLTDHKSQRHNTISSCELDLSCTVLVHKQTKQSITVNKLTLELYYSVSSMYCSLICVS